MHPWAGYRKDRLLTQQQVANELGIERLSVIRLEQGMFNNIAADTLTQLAHLYGRAPDELLEVYHGYQEVTRLEFSSTHASWKGLRAYEGPAHPLIYYREFHELSRNELCKGLCLDYSPISDYETNKQRTIPMILKQVSEEIHWDYTELESSVLQWRASGRSAQNAGIK